MNVVQNAVKVTQNSIHVTQNSINVARRYVKVVQNGVKVTQNSILVTQNSMKVVRSYVKVVQNDVKVTQNSILVTQNSMNVVRKSVKLKILYKIEIYFTKSAFLIKKHRVNNYLRQNLRSFQTVRKRNHYVCLKDSKAQRRTFWRFLSWSLRDFEANRTFSDRLFIAGLTIVF